VFGCLVASWHVFSNRALLVIVYRYMGKAPKPSDETNSSPASTGALLALTFIDTTWRLAVPSVGLTLVGVWLDQKYSTTPWLMLAGIVIGSALAIYLVYVQIKKVSHKES